MAKDDDQKTNTPKDPSAPLAPPAAGPLPQMPASSTTPPKKFAIGESTGNLTRDAIIEQQRGKFIEAGKSEAEAHDLAVKRGFEMVKEPASN